MYDGTANKGTHIGMYMYKKCADGYSLDKLSTVCLLTSTLYMYVCCVAGMLYIN